MTTSEYVLGHDDKELARLDQQAMMLADSTVSLLRLAGVTTGMRVLDLGTGLGHVARMASDLVGPSGQVTGVDQAESALAVARSRSDAVTFLAGDVRTFEPESPVDAVVCRLVLAYQPDPVEVVRRWMGFLRPGGVLLVMEYDMSGCRGIPHEGLIKDAIGWVDQAFTVVGQSQRLGPDLAGLMDRAGLRDVKSLGCQLYLRPGDPGGPAMLGGVVRSLLPAIERAGIASAAEVGIDTLQQRLAEQQKTGNTIICPPALVGAWGHL
ncbi:methyltransferase domain-containing protein [Actinocrispum sp. NPDC049592]|uniref:methyltransferase domain-containing protein n=1 Tax=Actinocrispum sp. NPDC049592 TaxID=3154835 RepID=UPI00344732E5